MFAILRPHRIDFSGILDFPSASWEKLLDAIGAARERDEERAPQLRHPLARERPHLDRVREPALAALGHARCGCAIQ